MEMGYLTTQEQTPKVHQLQTLSLLSMWVVEPIQEAGCMLQTEHERVCCHDESDSTRRRWCKGNLQPNTWEEVLPVEMSQLLTQNKTNTKIPRKLNRTKHGITPTYCYFCQIFKRVGRKICGVQNEQHVYLTGTFWPKKTTNVLQKRGVYLSIFIIIIYSL